jgi:hypothetical protein
LPEKKETWELGSNQNLAVEVEVPPISTTSVVFRE